jgi:NADP-dependent 3-hydroxy acid dehydrogenase YdfG
MNNNNSSSEAGHKTAIITGGGSGIGLAIAEKFVQQNIRVVIIGRDGGKLNAAKEKIGGIV